MDLRLRGRVAFVTGASGGLGYATALELAREGCRVAIASRSRERIEEAADQLATEAGADRSDLLPIVCDVTDEAHIREAVDEVVERFGPINILITNAGGPPSGYLADFDADDWRKAIELNLISTVNLLRSCPIPELRSQDPEVSAPNSKGCRRREPPDYRVQWQPVQGMSLFSKFATRDDS